MKTQLPESIENIKEAENYLLELIKNNEAYHPEEDVNDVVWNVDDAEEPTDAEALIMNELMDQIYDLNGFDPCEFILNNTAE